MKILSLALLVVGAVIAYGARFFLDKFYKKECSEKEIGILKSVGLFIALAGAIIIFTIK
ncbi:MAG: hypothetical protein IJN62_03220 [Clostridia bacterium]|nr:hypothetical protein [Clostridia bacterium]